MRRNSGLKRKKFFFKGMSSSASVSGELKGTIIETFIFYQGTEEGNPYRGNKGREGLLQEY